MMYTVVPKAEVVNHRNPPGHGAPQVIDHRQKIIRKGGADLNKADALKSQRDALLTAELQYKKRISTLEKEQIELVKSHEEIMQQNKMLKAQIEYGPHAVKLKRLQTEKREQEGVIEQLQDINKRVVHQLTTQGQNNGLHREENSNSKHWPSDLEKINKIREQRERMRQKQVVPAHGPFVAGKLSKPKSMSLNEDLTNVKDAYDREIGQLEKETQSLLVKIKQVKHNKEQIDWAMITGDRSRSKNVTIGNEIGDKMNQDLFKLASRLDEIKAKHEAASAFTDLVKINHEEADELSTNEEPKSGGPSDHNDAVKPIKSYKRRQKETQISDLENLKTLPSPRASVSPVLATSKQNSNPEVSPILETNKQKSNTDASPVLATIKQAATPGERKSVSRSASKSDDTNTVTTQIGPKQLSTEKKEIASTKSFKVNKTASAVQNKESSSQDSNGKAVNYDKNDSKGKLVEKSTKHSEVIKSPADKFAQSKTTTVHNSGGSQENPTKSNLIKLTTPVKRTNVNTSNKLEKTRESTEHSGKVAMASPVNDKKANPTSKSGASKNDASKKKINASVTISVRQENKSSTKPMSSLASLGRYDHGPESVRKSKEYAEIQTKPSTELQRTERQDQVKTGLRSPSLMIKATKKTLNKEKVGQNEYEREYNEVLNSIPRHSKDDQYDQLKSYRKHKPPNVDTSDDQFMYKLREVSAPERNTKRNQVSPMPIEFKSNGRLMDRDEMRLVMGNTGVRTDNIYKVY